MLSRRGKIAVDICFEPWVTWPLWFRDEIGDQAEFAPISAQLKVQAFSLIELLKDSVLYCEATDAVYLNNAETLHKLNESSVALTTKLGRELGRDYEVRGQFLKVSAEGHVENHLLKPRMVRQAARGTSANDVLDVSWRTHNCP